MKALTPQQLWAQKVTASGRCSQCGESRGADGTAIFCRAHADAFNARRGEFKRLRKEAGSCIRCGAPRGENGTTNHCRAHADEANEMNRFRTARIKSEGSPAP